MTKYSLIFSIFLMMFGCRSASSKVFEADSEVSWNSVGCVPSIGECRMSCPEMNAGRAGQPQENAVCVVNLGREAVECFCPNSQRSIVELPEPKDSWRRLPDCLISASECQNSFPDRRAVFFRENPEACAQSILDGAIWECFYKL